MLMASAAGPTQVLFYAVEAGMRLCAIAILRVMDACIELRTVNQCVVKRCIIHGRNPAVNCCRDRRQLQRHLKRKRKQLEFALRCLIRQRRRQLPPVMPQRHARTRACSPTLCAVLS